MSDKKFIPFFGAAVAAACLLAGATSAEANSTDRMMRAANGTRYEFGKTYNMEGAGVSNSAVVNTRDGRYVTVNGTRAEYTRHNATNATRVMMSRAANATDRVGEKVGDYVDDKAIEAAIKGRMIKDAGLKAADLNVYSFDNHVYLIGALNAEHRAEAERAAQNTDGVTKLTTHWFPEGTNDRVSDTALEAKIAANLLFAKDVPFTKVEVDVWGGNVVLLGTVASQGEIDRVMNEVRTVDGIKTITNYLTVHRDSDRR